MQILLKTVLFDGFLHSNDNKKLLKFDIDNEKDATRLKDEITSLSTNGLKF